MCKACPKHPSCSHSNYQYNDHNFFPDELYFALMHSFNKSTSNSSSRSPSHSHSNSYEAQVFSEVLKQV